MTDNNSSGNDPDKANKGFSGFDSLVTDNLDQTIADAMQTKPKKKVPATPALNPNPIATPPVTPPPTKKQELPPETKKESNSSSPPPPPDSSEPESQFIPLPSKSRLSGWWYFFGFIVLVSMLSSLDSNNTANNSQQQVSNSSPTTSLPSVPGMTIFSYDELTASKEYQQATSESKKEVDDLYALNFWTEMISLPLYADLPDEKKSEYAAIFDNTFANGKEIRRNIESNKGQVDILEDGSNPSSQSQKQTVPNQFAWDRPTAAPNGQPWPATAAYIKGYKRLHADGLSMVTVDNSQNDSDVFVKLVSLEGSQLSPVRQFFIPAQGKFTLNKVTAGSYDIRYRDLSDGGLARSESFDLKEEPTYDGTRYSNVTMTLYKVSNGNMQTFGLSEAEF